MSRIKGKEEDGVLRALEATAATAGRAIVYNAAAVGLGFLVLAFSGFEINSDMGLMTALTIILALLLDFLFLPILLMKMDGLEKNPKQ